MNEIIKEDYTEEEIRRATKKANKDLFLENAPFIIIIITIILIRIFIVSPVKVSGSSMNPTLNNGDILLLYKLQKKIKGINRFDMVVVDDDTRLIKRVIGLPGENIKYVIDDSKGYEEGILYINGEVVEEEFIDYLITSKTCSIGEGLCTEEGITLGENEYYVMGDNRGNSKDSRILGPVTYDEIEGITRLRLYPFTKIGNVN